MFDGKNDNVYAKQTKMCSLGLQINLLCTCYTHSFPSFKKFMQKTDYCKRQSVDVMRGPIPDHHTCVQGKSCV